MTLNNHPFSSTGACTTIRLVLGHMPRSLILATLPAPSSPSLQDSEHGMSLARSNTRDPLARGSSIRDAFTNRAGVASTYCILNTTLSVRRTAHGLFNDQVVPSTTGPCERAAICDLLSVAWRLRALRGTISARLNSPD